MKHRNLTIMLLALALLLVACGAALAADGTKQVGLVIAFPDGTQHTEIVTVPVTATTYDVLSQAQIALIGANGSFGMSVCSINKVGCPAANCFCDAKHFWAFYHLDQSGQWVASQEGVGAAVPADRAVEGFAWSDMDARYNPLVKPPVLTFTQIQAQQPAAASPARPAAPAAARPAAPSHLPTTGGRGAWTWLAALAAALLAAGWWFKRGLPPAGPPA